MQVFTLILAIIACIIAMVSAVFSILSFIEKKIQRKKVDEVYNMMEKSKDHLKKMLQIIESITGTSSGFNI